MMTSVAAFLALCVPAVALSTSARYHRPQNWTSLRNAVQSAQPNETTNINVSNSFNFSDYDGSAAMVGHPGVRPSCDFEDDNTYYHPRRGSSGASTMIRRVIIHVEDEVVWAIPTTFNPGLKCGGFGPPVTLPFFFAVEACSHLEILGPLTMSGSQASAFAVKRHANLTLNGTTVKSCIACLTSSFDDNCGGAIDAYGPGTFVEAFNVMFLFNEAQHNGGAVAVHDGARLKMSATTVAFSVSSDGDGGAIYADDASVEAFNVTINGNHALGNGGAVALRGAAAKVVLIDSHVYTNRATTEGGAIWADKYSNLTLIDTVLESNRADLSAGAVCLNGRSYANVVRSHFLANNAEEGGGAIKLVQKSQALINSSDFTDNTVDCEQCGAAIYVSSGNITVIRPSFLKNTMKGSTDNSLTIEPSANVVFSDYFSSSGGADPARSCSAAVDTANAKANGRINMHNCMSASSCCEELKKATTPEKKPIKKFPQIAIIAIGVAASLCVLLLSLFVHYYRKNEEARHHSDLEAKDLLDIDLNEVILDQSVNSDEEDQERVAEDAPRTVRTGSWGACEATSKDTKVRPRARTSSASTSWWSSPNRSKEKEKEKHKMRGQIDYKSIKWGRQQGGGLSILGEGTCGVVYEGSFKGRPVAIKRIRLPRPPSQLQRPDGSSGSDDVDRKLAAVRAEIQLLFELRHPNIMETYGVAFVRERQVESVCLVSELCRGSLDLYIQNRGSANGAHLSGRGSSRHTEDNNEIDYMSMPILTPQRLVRFMEQTAAALAFMHERRVVHRDLKPHNLFIAQDGSVRIGDFGLSRLLNQPNQEGAGGRTLTQQNLTANIGSPAYMAPELVSMPEEGFEEGVEEGFEEDSEEEYGSGSGAAQKARYGAAVDVYAFGIILNCLWRQCSPYDERRYRGAMHLLRCVEGGHRPQDPATKLGCPAFYVALTHKCWAPKPSDRITAQEALMLLRSRGESGGAGGGRGREEKFEEGDKVEANYKGKGKYYPGKISRAQLNGTYDIAYNDGEREMSKEASDIRSHDGEIQQAEQEGADRVDVEQGKVGHPNGSKPPSVFFSLDGSASDEELVTAYSDEELFEDCEEGTFDGEEYAGLAGMWVRRGTKRATSPHFASPHFASPHSVEGPGPEEEAVPRKSWPM
jgi:serine/threonine protein kinase